MKCNYKLQCPRCQNIFEIEVDTSISKSHYPTSCPHCRKKIEIRLVSESQLQSLQVSKTAHLKEEKTADKTTSDDIIFKCVRRTSPAEQRSSISQSLSASRVSPKSPEPQAISVEPISCPEPRPYSGSMVNMPAPRRYAPNKVLQKEPGRPKAAAWQTRKKSYRRGYQSQIPRKISKPSRGFGIFREPKKRLKLAMLLLIIVFILGISHGIISIQWGVPEHISSERASINTVDIDGAVIDYYTGRPIANCIIKIAETGQQDVTNSDGYYFISRVEVGDIEIVAEANGYSKIIKKVTVAPEQPANFNLELKPGVNVERFDETILMVQKSENTINVFAVIIILFAFFALLAAILIYYRNMFKICALSAFFSILSFGAGVGFVLGLVALILILLSGSSFKTRSAKAS